MTTEKKKGHRLPAGCAAAVHVADFLMEIGEPDSRWPGYIFARYLDIENDEDAEMSGGWPAAHFRPLTKLARDLLALCEELDA